MRGRVNTEKCIRKRDISLVGPASSPSTVHNLSMKVAVVGQVRMRVIAFKTVIALHLFAFLAPDQLRL